MTRSCAGGSAGFHHRGAERYASMDDCAPEDAPLNPFEEKLAVQTWAQRLLLAAERGTLSSSQVGQAAVEHLEYIREEGSLHGFPTTLIPLICLHRDSFAPAAQKCLDQISEAMCARARETRAARRFYEPLEYLEALTVLRLLAREDVEPDFEDAANEWLFREWGWGAHLCDSTSWHLLSTLCLLLLLDPEPPYDTKRLWERLVRIDDSFAGIPRVPATRHLALFSRQHSFRQKLATPAANDPQSHSLKRLGAEALLPTALSPAAELATPCFGGAVARTYRTVSGTLGTLSRFPLMPTLSLWHQAHAYPVFFWQDHLNQGFLKWQIKSGLERLELPGQPAFSQSVAELPQTHTLQYEGEALVLRLYHVPPGVTRIEDRWETRGQERLAVRCLPLSPGLLATDRLALAEGELPRVFAVLWALSLEGEITQEPVVAPVVGLPSVPRGAGEDAFDLDWQLPGGLWQVRIDPLEKEALCGR